MRGNELDGAGRRLELVNQWQRYRMAQQTTIKLLLSILVGSLFLPVTAECQFIFADKPRFNISDAKTSAPGHKRGVLISLSISPTPEFKVDKPLYICIFAPQEGSNDSLHRLDIESVDFNMLLYSGGNPLFTLKMKAKDGHQMGPLILQYLSKEDIHDRSLRFGLNDRLAVSQEIYPKSGKIELAVVEPQDKGDGFQFVITSNVISVEL